MRVTVPLLNFWVARDELKTVFPGHREVVFADTVFFTWVKIVININGDQKEIVEGLSIAQLLEELNIRPGRVVIELNRDIVSREVYGAAILKQGDTLEIVHFVGGG